MQHLISRQPRLTTLLGALLVAVASMSAQASSHREAPFITTQPKVDGTDFYMFRSYEGVAANGSGGRSDFVTLIANYIPLQDPYGGPNYFSLDPNALYEIHIDNNGDAKEDITFQFRAKNTLKGIALPISVGSDTKTVAIPLIQAGQVSQRNDSALNLNESYTVNIVRGDRRTGTSAALTHTVGGLATFDKPVDNIGNKTIVDYATYAGKHIYSVNIPGCNAGPAKLFVGQRKDPFAINLGVIFDLVNAPLGVISNRANTDAGVDDLADKNVTTLALEVPKACLTGAGNGVIGGWTTASLRQGQYLTPSPAKGHGTTVTTGGSWVQVSRLGMPLVNEVVIGLPDKDRFNSSSPSGDGQFINYVTNPTLPRLIEIAFGQTEGALAPSNVGRGDLVTTFLTGIPGVNQLATVTGSEMLRLNTGIAAVPLASQQTLGIVGSVLNGASDFAGFPNGRRPKDDIIDISLVAVMGGLCVANGDTNAFGFGPACKPSAVPLGATAFKLHDAVDQGNLTKRPLLAGFPYLNTPIPGAFSAP